MTDLLIEWGDNLCLGLPDVDAQHRELAQWLNRLELTVGAPESDPMVILDALYQLTRDHFAFEEQLMAEAGFPGTVAHRREHTMLIAELKMFIAGVRKGDERLDASTLHALKKWLVGHIVGSDREFASHLRASSCKP